MGGVKVTMHTCIHIHAVMPLDSVQLCIFPAQTCLFSSLPVGSFPPKYFKSQGHVTSSDIIISLE